MRRMLLPIALGLTLAACGTPSPNRMHSVDILSGDGTLAFEIKMNGCYIFDAVVRNRTDSSRGGLGATLVARSAGNDLRGSVILVFPATRAGGQVRADKILEKYEMGKLNKYAVAITITIINIAAWIMVYQINYSWSVFTDANLLAITSIMLGVTVALFSAIFLYFNKKINFLLDERTPKTE